ncbi:MAG: FecR domain-containing protein [Treponema sp.]
MKKELVKGAAGLVFLSAAAFAFADKAVVLSVAGKVEVERNGAWVSLQKDSVLGEGEAISTGFKSEAVIKYQDSVMKLGPLTRVTLEKLAATPEKDTVAVYLNTGNVHSSVNRAQNKRVSYTVRNSVAVASVRGTEFSFDGRGVITCSGGGISVRSAIDFEPAALGIANPADGKKGATKTQAATAEKALPAEGATTAFTAPTDVAPTGGVLVAAGQTADFSNIVSAAPAKPVPLGAKTQSAIGSGMMTAAEKEAIAMGGGDFSGEPVNVSAETPVSAAALETTGKVVINVGFGQ